MAGLVGQPQRYVLLDVVIVKAHFGRSEPDRVSEF